MTDHRRGQVSFWLQVEFRQLPLDHEGGVWVTGRAVTTFSPSSSVVTRMTAQGRSLTPSSWPLENSDCHS
jgi:hypothetical protein